MFRGNDKQKVNMVRNGNIKSALLTEEECVSDVFEP